MNIYLIGMPGSGKSTIGKRLANRLNRPHIDLDEYIERKSLMFIPEIFDAYGETFFRDLETNCLIELQDSKNTIISCGGGVVVKAENKTYMNGIIVYLSANMEVLKSRVMTKNQDRPLLKSVSMEELYEKRKDLYLQFSDVIIDSSTQEIDDLLREVERIEKSISN